MADLGKNCELCHIRSGVQQSDVRTNTYCQEVVENHCMRLEDVDILEHNEAFASASCAIRGSLGIPDESFNPHGGAIAIGHPLGATGARCLMTLVNAMRRRGSKRGIVTVCLGGGNAVAMMVECP